MKRIIFLWIMFLLLLFTTKAYAGNPSPITVDVFVSGNDVTIAHLESFRTAAVNHINSFPGGNIQAGSISTDSLNANANPENRWNEAFNDFVYTGLLPPTTSGTLTSTTTAGTAYISGVRVLKDATANTYTASRWTFVDLDKDGNYSYTAQTIGAAPEPSIASNTLRLARVSSDTTQVFAVRDDRVTSISLGGANSDEYRQGLNCKQISTTQIDVSAGVCYHGSTRVSKNAVTTLSVSTAADWLGGVSLQATATTGYIYIDSSGNIDMHTTAPTKTDTSGNSAGILRYGVISTTYYRCIGWFYMNSTGAGQLDTWGVGNFKDGDTYNVITRDITSATNLIGSSSTTGLLTMDIVTTGRPILCLYQVNGITSAGEVPTVLSVSLDNAVTLASEVGGYVSDSYWRGISGGYTFLPSAGAHTIILKARSQAGATYTISKGSLRIIEQ